jgi:hypothetical protein
MVLYACHQSGKLSELVLKTGNSREAEYHWRSRPYVRVALAVHSSSCFVKADPAAGSQRDMFGCSLLLPAVALPAAALPAVALPAMTTAVKRIAGHADCKDNAT